LTKMRNFTKQYIEKRWRFYQVRLDAGLTLIEQLASSGILPSRLSFSSGGDQALNERLIMEIKSESGSSSSRSISDARLQQIFEKLNSDALENRETMQTHTVERELFYLGMRFLEAGRLLDREKVKTYVEAGYPTNFKDPFSQRTILHNAAASSSLGWVEFLLDIATPDLLARDKRERLAYDLAYEFNTDLDVFNLLLEKTHAQALQESVPLNDVFTHPECVEEKRLLTL